VCQQTKKNTNNNKSTIMKGAICFRCSLYRIYVFECFVWM